jgi:hypothetical protein
MSDIDVLEAREAPTTQQPDAVDDGTMIDHVEHPPPEPGPGPREFVPPPGAFRNARRIAMQARREQERYLAGW